MLSTSASGRIRTSTSGEGHWLLRPACLPVPVTDARAECGDRAHPASLPRTHAAINTYPTEPEDGVEPSRSALQVRLGIPIAALTECSVRDSNSDRLRFRLSAFPVFETGAFASYANAAYVETGIRTRVRSLRGTYPSPLDDLDRGLRRSPS